MFFSLVRLLAVSLFENLAEQPLELFFPVILFVPFADPRDAVDFVTPDLANQRVECVVHEVPQGRRRLKERTVPLTGKLLALFNADLFVNTGFQSVANEVSLIKVCGRSLTARTSELISVDRNIALHKSLTTLSRGPAM